MKRMFCVFKRYVLALFVSAAGVRSSLSYRRAFSWLAFRAAFVSAGMLGSLAIPAASRAGVVLTLAESGSNVVGTLSGSITDLTGATPAGPPQAAVSHNRIRSNDSLLLWTNATPGSVLSYNQYNIASAPANFGTTSTVLSTANSSSASTSFLLTENPLLFIDVNYTLNTPVTGTLTFANTTLSAMGVTPGSYVWSWSGDSVTLNAVPEPSTYMMALAGLACGGYSMFRRRKRA